MDILDVVQADALIGALVCTIRYLAL
jgi:hypothetical protein